MTAQKPTDAEEQLLRRALTVIGEEAARDDPPDAVRAPARRTPWNRWRRPAALGAFGAAAALVIGLIVSLPGGDAGTEGGAGQALTLLEQAACTELAVVGRVVEVRPAPDDAYGLSQVRVTLAVTDWLEPREGPDRTVVTLPGPEGRSDDQGPLREGERLLIDDLVGPGGVEVFRVDPGDIADLDTFRPQLDRKLAEAREKGTRCPDFWIHRHDASRNDDVPSDS